VSGAAYRQRVAAALEDGRTFADLHASADGREIRVLFVTGDGATEVERVRVDGSSVPSIVDLVPAAAWDEREAHDRHGLGFDGHEPLRPLVDHDPRLERWTVPVLGDDAYQVAVGPIHAGVIESGHFRFHVVGERILHLDARLFYKHRGLERAAEGKTVEEGLAYAARACAGCAVANTLVYAQACENALGLVAGDELRRVRTVLLELERLWNHLNDIGAVCAGVGLAAGTNRFTALTEKARRLNSKLTGHRFLFRTVRLGGSDLRLHRDDVRAARAEVAALHAEAASAWRELLFNASLQDRLPGVGSLSSVEAARLGTVGPAARAAGLEIDVRAHSEGLAYESFDAVVPEQPTGDVRARVEQRWLELQQVFEVLARLLDDRIAPAEATRGDVERELGIARVESARGATSCIVERDGANVRRLRLRTGSYANWPSVAAAATDNLLPDFPLINKSFELCYACADR
jgi:Ni,Fe-hydrogenase III large subunit